MNEMDPRWLRAEQSIREAFSSLIKENGIDQIATTQIIERAGVNRSTFYMHYQNKYDLLDKMQTRFLDELEDIFRKSPTLGLLLGEESSRDAMEDYFSLLIGFLRDNREPFEGLATLEDSTFMSRFNKIIEDVLTESGAAHNLQLPTNYAATAITWMTTGLVSEWARGGFKESTDVFVQMLTDIATHIQRGIFGE